MAEARCKQGVSQQIQADIDTARRNASANRTWTHSASCSGYGSYANCTGTSQSFDSSGYAALGAALGAAISRNDRMNECMATYGYEGYEVQTN
mgnify:CR=1 FL=1